ncbi:MAG: radical SAM protein [Deltaproteobacteria bacterium]|nr:radical SAM protein [Deltaproteobacteria bacterium]
MERKIYYYLDKVRDTLEGKYVPPVTCEIDPSNACPLDCTFCMYAKFRKAHRQDLDWATYLRLITDLARHGVKSVTFTGGGEPLMHPRFNDMVEVALGVGLEVGLVTNGVLLHTVERPEVFTFIRVSLDAYDRATYERVKGADVFGQVLDNIMLVSEKNRTVGISYVVCQDNCHDLDRAVALAKNLKASYIQFKPAILNGRLFVDYKAPDGHEVIKTERYKGNDALPCAIAHLVGVVSATGTVYYCCQQRGNKKYSLGNLNETGFTEIWKQRNALNPEIKNCPPCRYMSYAKSYESVIRASTLFFEHRSFL